MKELLRALYCTLYLNVDDKDMRQALYYTNYVKKGDNASIETFTNLNGNFPETPYPVQLIFSLRFPVKDPVL